MTALDETQVKDGVDQDTVEAVKALSGTYKYGWNTEIEMEYAPKGLSEDIVRLISEKNNEPEWLLDWRLKSYKKWLKMEEPDWAMLDYEKPDFQDIYYYAAQRAWPKSQNHWMMWTQSCLKLTKSWVFR